MAPRSAIFAPFRNLGLIIVDEEHENSYNRRKFRAITPAMSLVPGRQTRTRYDPCGQLTSLETYHNCRKKRYTLLTLLERIDCRPMPQVELIDMTQESTDWQSLDLLATPGHQIRDRLERGEQTMIFLNRRGFASQMQCTHCGYVATCENCSITYTYHRKEELLLCHL